MSTPENLAMRKQLLQMKAEMQRMELSSHVGQVRQSLSWTRAVSAGVQGIFKNPQVSALSGVMGQVFKQYPMVSTVASLLLARVRKPVGRVLLKASLVAGLTASAYWYIRKDAIAARKARGQAGHPPADLPYLLK